MRWLGQCFCGKLSEGARIDRITGNEEAAAMVTKKTPAGKKLKVKKDTLKDLDAKTKSGKVKGGQNRLGACAGSTAH